MTNRQFEIIENKAKNKSNPVFQHKSTAMHHFYSTEGLEFPGQNGAKILSGEFLSGEFLSGEFQPPVIMIEMDLIRGKNRLIREKHRVVFPPQPLR